MTIPLPARRSNSILLTSLVDVMFVLLFFFMLTSASVDRRALQVDFAAADRSNAAATTELRLLLLGPSTWQLGNYPIEPAMLQSALRDQRPARVVVIPSSGVSLQVLTDVIGLVRSAGVELRLAQTSAR